MKLGVPNELCVEVFHQPQIGQLGVAVHGHQDVVGRDVPMNQPALVGPLQTGADLRDHRHRPGFGKRAFPIDELPQRLSLDELHDEIGLAAVQTKIEYANNIRMAQPTGDLAFLGEAHPQHGIVGHLVRQDLDGDRVARIRIAPLVHAPLAAMTDASQDRVVGDLRRDAFWGDALFDCPSHQTVPLIEGSLAAGAPR